MLFVLLILHVLLGAFSGNLNIKNNTTEKVMFVYEEGIELIDGFLNLIQGKSATIKISLRADNMSQDATKIAFLRYSLIKYKQTIEIGTFNDASGVVITPSPYSRMFKINYDQLKLINVQEEIEGFAVRIKLVTRGVANEFNMTHSMTTPSILVQTKPHVSCVQEGMSFDTSTTVSCAIIAKRHAEYTVLFAVMVSNYEIVQPSETKDGHYYIRKVEINFFPDVRQQHSIIIIEAYIPEKPKGNSVHFSYALASTTSVKLEFKEDLKLRCGNFSLNEDYFEIQCNVPTSPSSIIQVYSRIPGKSIKIEKSNTILYDNSFLISINAESGFLNEEIRVEAQLGKYRVSVVKKIVIPEESPPFNTKIKFVNEDGVAPPFKCQDMTKYISIDCQTSTVKGHGNVSIYRPDGILELKRHIDGKEVPKMLETPGYWKCVADNEYGKSVAMILVNVEDIPCYATISLQSNSSLKKLSNMYIIPEKADVTIKCSTHSNMLPVYFVLMEGDTPLRTNEDGIFRTRKITLISGIYKCVVINPLGFKESDYISIYVQKIEGPSNRRLYGFIILILILGALSILFSSVAIFIKGPRERHIKCHNF